MLTTRFVKRLADRGIGIVCIYYVDLAGITRSKPLVNRETDSIFRYGFKTARANLDGNTVAPLTPGSGLNISQGDVSVIPDPATVVFPSYAPGSAHVMGDIRESDGGISQFCARNILKRATDSARKKGYEPIVGLESEFHLVKLQEGKPLPADTSGVQTLAGYNEHRHLLEAIAKCLPSLGVSPLKVHVEGGRGQMEVDLAHEPALRAGDGFVYFKEAVKALSRDEGLIASFMPKIGSDWWGSGLHIHISLADKSGRNVFADTNDKRGLGVSRVCYNFIGGILRHARALCAIAAPTANSYKRLLPGRWNADAVAYGPGNRGAAVRIPDEREAATRIEVRMPDNSCNIYLTLASLISAGLEGVEKSIDPGDPLLYDASGMDDRERVRRGLELMPRSQSEALAGLEGDKLLGSLMGKDVFNEFLTQKYFEVSQAADQVTQWEVSHFLDLF